MPIADWIEFVMLGVNEGKLGEGGFVDDSFASSPDGTGVLICI
jgi:hypothetical protein